MSLSTIGILILCAFCPWLIPFVLGYYLYDRWSDRQREDQIEMARREAWEESRLSARQQIRRSRDGVRPARYKGRGVQQRETPRRLGPAVGPRGRLK